MGIALGGDRVGGQEAALQQILTFYILNGMIPVSGGFFGANLGATFWTKDTLEGAKQDEEGFRSLKKTVKRFAEFLKKYRKVLGENRAWHKEQVEAKKRKVAWGITGAGDKIAEFIEVMKELKKEYENTVEIQVYLSKAAETVLKFYKLEDT